MTTKLSDKNMRAKAMNVDLFCACMSVNKHFFDKLYDSLRSKIIGGEIDYSDCIAELSSTGGSFCEKTFEEVLKLPVS